MSVKPIYEFLVWDNCNNNCKFCFQRLHPRVLSLDQQKETLSKTIGFLKSPEFIKGSHVLIVGGELFDVSSRREFLVPFFRELVSMMKSNAIDLLYVNTNLIFSKDCMKMLQEILEIFDAENLFSRLRFTTSYDLEGRFRTEDSKSTFIANIKSIKDKFSGINVVTNMILTKRLCQAILSNEFDIFDFMRANSTAVNLIPYIILNKDMSSDRDTLFKAITYLYQVNPVFVKSWISNQDLKQPRKMFYIKNDEFVSCECEVLECGHSKNFTLYDSEKKRCFACDVKQLVNHLKA